MRKLKRTWTGFDSLFCSIISASIVSGFTRFPSWELFALVILLASLGAIIDAVFYEKR